MRRLFKDGVYPRAAFIPKSYFLNTDETTVDHLFGGPSLLPAYKGKVAPL